MKENCNIKYPKMLGIESLKLSTQNKNLNESNYLNKTRPYEMFLTRLFYNLKPAIPRRLQIFLRRQIALYKRKKYAHIWPIDPDAGNPPEGWKGWPDGKKFAFVLSHDVDTQKGHNNILKLAELEEGLGFRSSCNFVPERYTNSDSLHKELRQRGFEIGVHGLKHDGKLFSSHLIFKERAVQINKYLKKWRSTGFTSPSMHHNKDWLHDLKITHSISTFDTDPFEPQPDSLGTVFPYRVQNGSRSKGYFELPYTLPQDHLLYVILRENSNQIWKQKVDWIAENGGMALLNTHTDYVNFSDNNDGMEEYKVELYIDFLEYVKRKYSNQYWTGLPNELVRFLNEKYTGKAI